MGCCSSRYPIEIRAVMIGLDNAGKTAILRTLQPGIPNFDALTPTFQPNIETIEWNDVSITIWDAGGNDKIRPLWRHWYNSTDAIIFVVDSTDHERIGFMSQYKCELLVNGYIHKQKDKYNISIPMELYDIFFRYYYNSNNNQYETARYQFHQAFREPMLSCCEIWLILCNKQDSSDAISVKDIDDMLDLDAVKGNESREFAI